MTEELKAIVETLNSHLTSIKLDKENMKVWADIIVESVNNAAKLTEREKALVDALEWAKPYVARIRDTEKIDKVLSQHKENK